MRRSETIAYTYTLQKNFIRLSELRQKTGHFLVDFNVGNNYFKHVVHDRMIHKSEKLAEQKVVARYYSS